MPLKRDVQCSVLPTLSHRTQVFQIPLYDDYDDIISGRRHYSWRLRSFCGSKYMPRIRFSRERRKRNKAVSRAFAGDTLSAADHAAVGSQKVQSNTQMSKLPGSSSDIYFIMMKK
jgi:hypothetical protein